MQAIGYVDLIDCSDADALVYGARETLFGLTSSKPQAGGDKAACTVVTLPAGMLHCDLAAVA